MRTAEQMGIQKWPVHGTPVAVIDLETTGLHPGADRVIEVSVLRIDPGSQPRLVLDTLINPRCRVRATEIHGITDEDVAGAPEFKDIAQDLIRCISGCVLTAYNAYFDMRFLEHELHRAGVACGPWPFFCLMYMRPMLGLGRRCSLEDACRAHQIEHVDLHVAAADAQAGGKLLDVYLETMAERDLRTFGDLASLRRYKFLDSFLHQPLVASIRPVDRCARIKSRSGQSEPSNLDPVARDERHRIGEYWEGLKAVVADLEITEDELQYMEEKRRRLGLDHEQLRMLHARAFATVISQFIEDSRLDDREASKLRRLHNCLHQLGWAPGD